MTELVVPHRCRGPARSGNGGWTAGALAQTLAPGATVRVTLRRPPALDTAYDVRDGVATLDGEVMGEAEVVEDTLEPVAPVSAEEAREATRRYPGLTSHPFPTCFSCGTGRAEGDGLRIFPGQVADSSTGRTRVAATWTPHESSVPITWAALDCPGGWAGDIGARLMVLGRITARVDALPAVGSQHVVVAEHRGTEGRKTSTAATLYDGGGRTLGTAEHVWIAVDPADFN